MNTQKKRFECTLWERTLQVDISGENGFNVTITFDTADEWNSFSMYGKVYDIHLLLEDVTPNVTLWSVSIYACRQTEKGDWVTDCSEKATQLVDLIIHSDSNEDEEEAECIAREYEWTCVHCQKMNIFYEYTEEAHCSKCGKKNKIREPEHAYE